MTRVLQQAGDGSDTKKGATREQERLLSLWVTMPNYARIVYGFVPPWHWSRRA